MVLYFVTPNTQCRDHPQNSILAVSPGRLPYYMAMKTQSIGNHHSVESTASSNNNRLLIWCQDVVKVIQSVLRLFSLHQSTALPYLTTGAVLIGLGIRLWLLGTNPLWGDEMYSIWAAKQPWQQVWSGSVDVVHPPLYYIFLKTWMVMSDHLVWLRLPSVLASLGSMICIYQLGLSLANKPRTATLAQWWLIAYALSGFHIVFDWSVRMYAFIPFLSLLTLIAIRKNWSPYVLTLLASVGLLLDYAYVWSFGLIWVWSFWQTWHTNDQKKMHQLLAFTLGTLPFGIWQIWRLPFFQAGLNGILWMNDVLRPDFFIPFFLGTHSTTWLTTITFVYLAVALWLQRRQLDQYSLVWWLLGGSALLVEATYIFSLLQQPLLHMRSMQIVGLSITLLWGVALTEPKVRWIGIGLLLTAAATVVPLFRLNSLVLLTEFYPWKYMRTTFINQQKQTGGQLYVTAQPNTSSPLHYQSLLYSLDGKETWNSTPIHYITERPPAQLTNCKVIWEVFAKIEVCPQAN